MRFLVTPTFTDKLALLAGEGLADISYVVNVIKSVDRTGLTSRESGLEVRALDTNIFTIKRGIYRIYASFGSDSDGEYLLLLDIAIEGRIDFALEGVEPNTRTEFIATKDPQKNPLLDPRRNMAIDPNRNMAIDPNRNMAIDPRRNMAIDPNRNMAIDPRRNMAIDPSRNMAIDPRRNMAIDPNRNMTIDPRRNRFYGGPYLYNKELCQEGFIVRANERVSLIFDTSARFTSFIVFSENGIGNVFDLSCGWIGFLVPTKSDVILRFDNFAHWVGIIV